MMFTIMTVRTSFNEPVPAPLSEIALYALLADAQFTRSLNGFGSAKLFGQGAQQLALPVTSFGRWPVEFAAGKFLIHMRGMLDEHPGDGHRRTEVLVVAIEGARKLVLVVS